MKAVIRSIINTFQGRTLMGKLLLALPVALLASGCASVINDVTHPIKVETQTEAGVLVAGADCTLSNDKATSTMKSGETGNVRRSGGDLEIVCRHPSNPEAIAKATSRVNGGMFGNILIGGGIGAVVDHARGTAYTYPSWVKLVFGKVLTFDRRDEQEGQPTPAAETTNAAAPASSASAPEAAKKP